MNQRRFFLKWNNITLLITFILTLFFLSMEIYVHICKYIEYDFFVGEWFIDFDETRNNTWYGKAMPLQKFEKLKAKLKDELLEIKRKEITKEVYNEKGEKKKIYGDVKIVTLSEKHLLIKTQEVTGSDLLILFWRISESQISVSYILQLPGITLANAPTFVLKRKKSSIVVQKNGENRGTALMSANYLCNF